MSDAMEAFRAIMAHRSQWPGLVLALPLGGYGIDTRLPFGLASATGVWGSVADLVKIVLQRIFPELRVIKWVDDFIFLKPKESTITLDQVHAATKDLGFPWHPSKRSEFDTSVKYLGFIWNLESQTVMLPDEKRLQFADLAKRFTTSEPRSLKELRELSGSLQHVAMMARDMAPYTSEMISFLSAWNKKSAFQKLHVPPQVQDEAKHWCKTLGHELVRSIATPGKTFPVEFYVDASTTWGIGITCGSEWAAWMLLSGWDKDSRGIGWAEAAALELGVRQAVAMGAKDCILRIHSDNKGVIGAFRRGRSRGRSANSIMRSLIAFEMQHRLDPPFDRFYMQYGSLEWYRRRLKQQARERMTRPGRQGAGVGRVAHPTSIPAASSSRPTLVAKTSSSIHHTPKSFIIKASARKSSYPSSHSASSIAQKPLIRIKPSPLYPSHPPHPPSSGQKILAKDRILAIAPISSKGPMLKTSSGFDFDPTGQHWMTIKHVLASALEISTRQNYGSGIQHFTDFCDASGIPYEHRFPISQDLLLAFVVHLGQTCRASTIRTYIASLATWHHTWNQPFVRSDGVSIAIRAIEKHGPPKLPLRPPVTSADLDSVFARLDVASNPLHAAVWACALMTWWSMCRLGETTIAVRPVKASRHVMRSNIVSQSVSDQGLDIVRIHLPWTKTTLVEGLDKFLVRCGNHLDPVFALQHHLSLSPHSPLLGQSTPLFAYKIPGSDRLMPLMKDAFLSVFDKALKDEGREQHVGHSFRIGGATAHWRAGVPIETIQLMGGWKGDTVVKYLRDLGKGLANAHARTAEHIAAHGAT
ncbi:hypothetical protein CF326_g5147 [Tilletia indica]|nr:hypothetical protein CF326_g5147 [Tilletia indica]